MDLTPYSFPWQAPSGGTGKADAASCGSYGAPIESSAAVRWVERGARRIGLGAVAGAVIGNAIERTTTQEEALEIMVQLRNGERRAIVQAKGSEDLKPGEPVIIVTTGGKVRVTRAPAGTAPAAPANPAPLAAPRG